MRIKKHTNKNEYLLTSQGMWVRNFTKKLVPYLDINKTIKENDHFNLLNNEYKNSYSRPTWIDTEKFTHRKAVIISDGYGFATKHKLLENIPNDVAIIGVHGALVKWELPKSMTYYVVNNPYQECLRYLPKNKKSLPKCIASIRTNHNFISGYKGMKYRYVPVSESSYKGMDTKETSYEIDDYRNPICAAIGLAYRFGVEKLLLLCCDDAFKDERPGAEKTADGMWIYPPQKTAHGLVDGCLYWLKNQQVSTASHSSGEVYNNAVYIEEDRIVSYLGDIDDKKE